MNVSPLMINEYHVFVASPSDMGTERKTVRKFFNEYNQSTARLWGVRFEVVDSESYATIGVGRPQELITKQTLETFKDSLALVIGLMGQRFGSATGVEESGTEEEFNWAFESNQLRGFPEIKWFFCKFESIVVPEDPEEAEIALEQWKKVREFRKRIKEKKPPVFYKEYESPDDFADVLRTDLFK